MTFSKDTQKNICFRCPSQVTMSRLKELELERKTQNLFAVIICIYRKSESIYQVLEQES